MRHPRDCECGGIALPVWGGKGPLSIFWSVECQSCGKRGRHKATEKQAVRAWNKGQLERSAA